MTIGALDTKFKTAKANDGVVKLGEWDGMKAEATHLMALAEKAENAGTVGAKSKQAAEIIKWIDAKLPSLGPKVKAEVQKLRSELQKEVATGRESAGRKNSQFETKPPTNIDNGIDPIVVKPSSAEDQHKTKMDVKTIELHSLLEHSTAGDMWNTVTSLGSDSDSKKIKKLLVGLTAPERIELRAAYDRKYGNNAFANGIEPKVSDRDFGKILAATDPKTAASAAI